MAELDIENAPIGEVVDKIMHLRGNFVLASGKTSTEYFDSRRMSCSPREGRRIAKEFVAKIKEVEVDTGQTVSAVGGPESGSLPLMGALMYALAEEGMATRGFYVRKEAKGHGTGKRIEGFVEKGDRLVIVEDVITTGGSVLDSIKVLEEAGAEIAAILCIVNRPEKKADGLEKYKLVPLLDLSPL